MDTPQCQQPGQRQRSTRAAQSYGNMSSDIARASRRAFPGTGSRATEGRGYGFWEGGTSNAPKELSVSPDRESKRKVALTYPRDATNAVAHRHGTAIQPRGHMRTPFARTDSGLAVT